MFKIDCLCDIHSMLGESPVWIKEEKSIYWVDIIKSTIHCLNLCSGKKREWEMPSQTGFLVPRTQGGFIIGIQDELAFWDPIKNTLEYLGGPEKGIPDNRYNDSKADQQGNLWVGTLNKSSTHATGKLYCMQTDLTWEAKDENYIVSNGPTFSPDGKILYHSDTMKGMIYAFDLSAEGNLSNKRAHIIIPESNGWPDGITTDTLGGIWVAHWGGWRLSRFFPNGEFDKFISLPVSQVTSVTFGGENLDILFVTSAAGGLSQQELLEQPQAGGLFQIKGTEAIGLLPNMFKG